jgi:hypothetical protein
LHLARRRAGDDVRRKGQLLEGLHLLLELVGIRRVQLGLRQTLLLLSGRQHRVQILQAHLLLRLAEARELLSEARDALPQTRRLLLRTKPSLNARQSKLRGLKTEVPGCLRTGQPKACLLARDSSRLLLRTKPGLDALQPKLCPQLSFGNTKLCRRLRQLCRLRFGLLLLAQSRHSQLRCLSASAAKHLRAAETNVGTKPCCRLLPRQSLLERRLRPLRRAFKAACPHLCCSARLLFQHIPLQLLLRHGLPRAAKGARANSLRPQASACDLTLAPNVCQGLLHSSVLKLAHERADTCWVVHTPGPGKRADTAGGHSSRHLPGSKKSSAPGINRPRHRCAKRTGLHFRRAETGLAHSPSSGDIRYGGIDLPRDLPSKLLCGLSGATQLRHPQTR